MLKRKHVSATQSLIEKAERSAVSLEKNSQIESISPDTNGIRFCRYCGKRIDNASLFCRNCGKALSVQLSQNDEKLTQIEAKEFSLPFADLPPKLQRAFLFLEDGDWNRANQYIESYLDDNPTDAYAYIGKTLLDLRIQQLSELASKKDALKENRSFQKALRFASEELKKQLEAIQSDTFLHNEDVTK